METSEILKEGVTLIACLTALAVLSFILRRVLGWIVDSERLYYVFLAPGTVVHETCHLLACLVLLVRVRRVEFFRMRREEDGTVQLGQVIHDRAGPIRNGLIGVAPLLGISGILILLAWAFIPRNAAWYSLFGRWETYVFLLITFLLALTMSPSLQDLKSLPLFLVTSAIVGGLVYLVVGWIDSGELAEAGATLVSFLRSVNSGLYMVMGAAAAVGLILGLTGWLRRKTGW